MRFLGLLALVVGVVLLAAVVVARFGLPGSGSSDGLMVVAVTIPPQADLVERIAGDGVRVEIAVPPGRDPHVFSPSPRQVMELSRAAVYFRIGMPLEDQLLLRLGGGAMRTVDTTADIHRRSFTDGEGSPCDGHHHGHSREGHGHDCEAHAGHPDPHVWLAPALLAVQADRMSEALCEVDPAGAESYRENLQKLKKRLDEVDAEIVAMLAPYRGRAFYVFHPSFGYFAEAYGLRQMAVELEGKSPSPRQLRTLVTQAKADGVKVIFVQPQFDQRSAESIAAAIGGSVVAIDPLRKNVIDNLVDIAAQLKRGFEQ